jgi:hypothetical protein
MVVGQNNTNQQEESVYNLIPRSEVRASKSFRYILIHHFSVYLNHISNSYESKFKQNVRESFKGGKHEHRNDTKQTVSNDRKYFFFLFLKNNFLFDKS